MKYNILKKLEDRILLKNTSYLLVFQIINYLIPFVILPYVIQSVTIEKYGVIIFIQTVITYFIMLTEFGFNISATQDIAHNRDNLTNVNQIFNRIILSKLYLAIIGFLVLMIILFSFQSLFEEDIKLYIYAYLLVFGMALSPTWLFQGFENMKVLVISNFIIKLFFVLTVFIFINNEEDFGIFILLNSLSYLILGIVLLFLAKKTYSISFYYVNINRIYHELKKTFHYFTSKISSTLYLNNNILLLGVLGSEVALGYYAIAEKVIRALLHIMASLNQASLPYIRRAFSKNKIDGISKSIQLIKYLFFGLVLFTLLIYISAELIVILLIGVNNFSVEIVNLIQLMSPIPLFGILSYFIAYNLLSNLGMMKTVSSILVIVAVINTLLNLILIPYYNEYGAAFSILMTEGGLLLLLIIVYKNKVI
jgi:PST family polysaccharide transporter